MESTFDMHAWSNDEAHDSAGKMAVTQEDPGGFNWKLNAE